MKCLDETAHMTADCGRYAGLDRYEARKAIVADLEAGGYLKRSSPTPTTWAPAPLRHHH